VYPCGKSTKSEAQLRWPKANYQMFGGRVYFFLKTRLQNKADHRFAGPTEQSEGCERGLNSVQAEVLP